MGGAHAIAALAYGTATVPRVDKIVGPGNQYVAAAKRLVFGDVAIDSEAGPTEVLIVADKSATPAWVAADLLSQAEHDEMACATLFTASKALVPRVQEQLARQLKTLERAGIARKSLATRGAIVVAKDLAQCLALADRYAPETCAGVDDARRSRASPERRAIFTGHYAVAVGDYGRPNSAAERRDGALLRRSGRGLLKGRPGALRASNAGAGARGMRLAALEGSTRPRKSVEADEEDPRGAARARGGPDAERRRDMSARKERKPRSSARRARPSKFSMT